MSLVIKCISHALILNIMFFFVITEKNDRVNVISDFRQSLRCLIQNTLLHEIKQILVNFCKGMLLHFISSFDRIFAKLVKRSANILEWRFIALVNNAR